MAPDKRQALVLAFCQALQSLKTDEEVAKFITDLLSPQEVEMLAKRLHIAQLLLQEKRYEYIRSELKVSFGTIARVATWIGLSGEGFRIALSRKKKPLTKPTIEELYNPDSDYNFKRRYSVHYWPQLLIERLLKESDNKHKQKLFTILRSIEVKKEIFTPEFNRELFKESGVASELQNR